MTSRAFVATSALVGFVALTAAGLRAAGDKVAFPENYAKGVLYWVQDRPANKQVREYYTSREALEAARKGQPLPSGTVITVVQYNVKLDPQGNPVADARGRFIKTDIRGYTAMEKRSGWGAEYPENIRNGEWEYQSFTTAKTPNTSADLNACFTCHKKQETRDYVFSYEQLRSAGT
jgi:hypothetical protein